MHHPLRPRSSSPHQLAIPSFVVAVVLAFAPASVSAGTVYAVHVENTTTKVLTTIDTSTGAATTVGSVAVGGISAGAAALDGSTLWVAGDDLVGLDTTSGTISSTATISPPASQPLGPGLLVTSASSNEPLGLFVATPSGGSGEQLATIDSSTGATSAFGGALAIGRVTGAVARDGIDDETHFVVQDTSDGSWGLATVDGSGALTANVDLSIAAGWDSVPVLLAHDPSADALYGVANETATTKMHLVSIDPATGVMSVIGAGFDVDGYVPSVGVFDSSTGQLSFVAQSTADTSWRIFSVAVADGSLAASPVITPDGSYGARPLVLAAASTGLASPNEISSDSLRLAKGGGILLNLTWTASCTAAADDYSVHIGTLAGLYDHTGATCSTGGATSSSLTLLGPNRYYLIVPTATSTSVEGSYGRASSGSERPVSSTTCFPTQLAGSCP